MLRFYAEGFITISHHLAQIKLACEEISLKLNGRDTLIPTPPIEKDLTWLYQTLQGLNLPMSAISAQRFLDLIIENKEKVSSELLQQGSTDLWCRLFDELKGRNILIVSSDKEQYVEASEIFWGKEIFEKLSDLTEDLDESLKCFVFNVYTACIFHLMRVMEKEVQKLGASIGVTIPADKNWQAIINDIRGILNKKYPSHSDPCRIKYENILGHLETIKIAWRNPTMHPKATYTEDEAKKIIDAVKIFTQDLIKIV